MKKRCEPRRYEYDKRYLDYVTKQDMVDVHGKEWEERWAEAAGLNTGILVSANHPSHGLPTAQFGIYYHDYIRFADLIDNGTPTYFD